jgi:hypothetical protein
MVQGDGKIDGPLSPAAQARLTKIAALPDEAIDIVDIPEAPEENWRLARRGSGTGRHGPSR